MYLWDRYRLSRIRIDIRYSICVNLWVPDWVVSVGQIPENTDWTVSGLILAIVFMWSLSSWLPYICGTDTWEYRLSRIRLDIGYSICLNLEFLIELYLDWYRSKSSFRSRSFTTVMILSGFSLLTFIVKTRGKAGLNISDKTFKVLLWIRHLAL